jgi:hypothetical protein
VIDTPTPAVPVHVPGDTAGAGVCASAREEEGAHESAIAAPMPRRQAVLVIESVIIEALWVCAVRVPSRVGAGRSEKGQHTGSDRRCPSRARTAPDATDRIIGAFKNLGRPKAKTKAAKKR